jgi:hypothetical protein
MSARLNQKDELLMGRGVVIAAIVVYVGVMLGCVLNAPVESAGTAVPQANVAAAASDAGGKVSVPPRAASRQVELPLRGVGMQLHRIDWTEEYKKSIDEIKALGADAVLLVVDARMENGSSSRIYLDVRFTPTPAMLGELIRHAKDKGLRVVLMPIVLLDKPRGLEWRGTINPEDWGDWWESYRGLLYHYSWIAEGNKADVLVVGSELVSTESKTTEWKKTISMVRDTFKGMLTYSANWDHYKDIPFWDELDLIAMNSYYKLGENHRVTVDEIVQKWQPYKKNILEFSRKQGKPFLFTEVGWHSLQNTAKEPWDYTQEHLPIDQDLQRRLWEGFFRTWHGTPEMGGFMVWEWPPGPGGVDNKGYTPEGKPAEQVIKEWFAK